MQTARLIKIIALGAVVTVGGWAVYHRDQIKSVDDAVQLIHKQWTEAIPASFTDDPPDLERPNVLRIAAFNIQTFGPKKSSDEVVMDRLAEICRLFDVVAIQEVRGDGPRHLSELVRRINQNRAGPYAFTISEPQGRSSYTEQAAFVFNQRRVRLDDSFSYTIQDPDDVLVRPPFVGWFRAAEPRPDQAFTFTLVNVHICPKSPASELVYLQELFRVVRKDGRGEDDIIIAGDFNAGDRGLEHVRQSGLTWAISNEPTNTRFTAQYDNLVFDSRATVEFTGTSGVFNIIRHFNITLEEALGISDHLPVWAEFSIYEGFKPGQVAVDAALDAILR